MNKFDEWNIQEYRVPSQYSDFKYAAEIAGLDHKTVKHLMACVPGEADGSDWYWIYLTQEDKYGYLSGGCDYSGWGCMGDHANYIEADTLEDLFSKIPGEIDEWEMKNFEEEKIKEQLTNQLDGKQPYALREEKRA